MNDFDYEVMQKKSLVPSARHRKNGSKSKKCTLPSDHLTPAQKRKLNGPVYTVNMDQPMTWEKFKPLPDTLKREYLSGLIGTYEASQRMLAGMMGVSQSAIRVELNRLGVSSGPTHGRAIRGAGYERRKAVWDAFCNGVVGGGNNVEPEVTEQVEEPHVWDLNSPYHDLEEEASARAQERLESIEAQGVSMHQEEEKPAENKAEMAETKESDSVGESVLTSLTAQFEGDADDIGWQLRDMMFQLFAGDRVKVKLSVEVC